jgi:hypothetical protein
MDRFLVDGSHDPDLASEKLLEHLFQGSDVMKR